MPVKGILDLNDIQLDSSDIELKKFGYFGVSSFQVIEVTTSSLWVYFTYLVQKMCGTECFVV